MKYIFILNTFGKRDITSLYKKIDVVSKSLNIDLISDDIKIFNNQDLIAKVLRK